MVVHNPSYLPTRVGSIGVVVATFPGYHEMGSSEVSTITAPSIIESIPLEMPTDQSFIVLWSLLQANNHSRAYEFATPSDCRAVLEEGTPEDRSTVQQALPEPNVDEPTAAASASPHLAPILEDEAMEAPVSEDRSLLFVNSLPFEHPADAWNVTEVTKMITAHTAFRPNGCGS